MRIGFIGTGKMGAPMARNLMRAGHAMVVHDSSSTAAKALLESGATWADSPSALASSSDVVFTSLPGPEEVRVVALGPHGIVEGSRDGMIYVDTSTGSASLIREIEAQLGRNGVAVLDAPVSGGVSGAESGTLAVMVGGSPDAFRVVLPLLESIGRAITYVGPIGAGTIAKLVHNSISMSTRIAVEEGLALAVKAGVSPETMLQVLLNGSFGKQLVLTSHIPELLFSGDFEHPRFKLGLSYKDVGLALELAEESGASLSMAELTYRYLQEAMDRGWAEFDNLVTMRLFEERAGIEVRSGSRA